MSTSFGIIKGALRNYSDGLNVHALLEIKNLLENEQDCWTAYFVKGKANAALGRHEDAIADFNLFLEMSTDLNERHRRHVIQSMALCASKLAEKQKRELGFYFKKGPDGQGQKRGMGAILLSPSGSGRIAQVGSYLFDHKEKARLERLMASEEITGPGVEVMSKEEADSFNELLEKIDAQKGVVGSVIIGHDLFVRACSLPETYDARSLAISSFVVFTMAEEQDKFFEFYKGGQAIVRVDLGYILLQEFDGCVLAILCNEMVLFNLVKLADRVARLLKKKYF